MIYIEPTAGLGNRLRAVLSAYRIAEKYHQKLCIVWNEDSALGAKFGDLFEYPADVKVIEVSNRSVKKDPFRRIRGDLRKKRLKAEAVQIPVYDDGCAKDTQRQMHERIKDCISRQKDIYISAWCQFEQLDQIPEMFGKIFVPSARVKERGASLWNRITKETYGVHIRRTDHADAISHSPMELFVHKMQDILRENPNAEFYCASDDSRVQQILKESFAADRLIFYDRKDFSRKSRAGGQDALIEMLALSGCRKILGSYESSYSELAAAIGNVELEVMNARG